MEKLHAASQSGKVYSGTRAFAGDDTVPAQQQSHPFQGYVTIYKPNLHFKSANGLSGFTPAGFLESRESVGCPVLPLPSWTSVRDAT